MAFDAFALILTMLGLGMAFSRLRALPDNTADVLNRIVLYVCLPAAVLIYVPRLHLDASLIGLVATPWLLMLASLVLVGLATRAFGFARDVHAVLLICVALANSSFIGYPMVRAARRSRPAVCGGLRPVRHLRAAVHLRPVRDRALQRRYPAHRRADPAADREVPRCGRCCSR